VAEVLSFSLKLAENPAFALLALVPVKGLEEPVEVFELVGASHLRRRLQAAAARGLTPFVGRQPELAAPTKRSTVGCRKTWSLPAAR